MTADDFYPAADSSNYPTDISSAIAKHRLALEDNSETYVYMVRTFFTEKDKSAQWLK